MNNKLIISIILGLGFISTAALAETTSIEGTLSFTTSDHITVKSNTGLVAVTVNATILSGQENHVQTNILNQLKKVLPAITWKTVNYNPETSASGATNITLSLQARLTQPQIDTLTRFISQHRSPNQTIQSRIVSYKPSTATLNKAKNELMTRVYLGLQKQARAFNHKTHSHYYIKNVSYQTGVGQMRRLPSSMLLMDAAAPHSNTKSSPSLRVAEDISLTASVVLEEIKPNNIAPTQRIVGGNSVLPPAYLSVKGFQKCLSTKDFGTWKGWCLPHNKPAACDQNAWNKLNQVNLLSCGQQ